MVGITAYGAYIPRTRLSKKAMADANTWFDASLGGLAKGERSVCNWDEDSITMAVEAAQDCLSVRGKKSIDTLYLASTTQPFLDRQNSVVISEALNLGEQVRTMDVNASQRAATSALLTLLDRRSSGESLLVASEHRRTKCGSRQEMLWGDAAAAVTLGSDNVIAEFVDSHSLCTDFVDHYRGEDNTFNYDWEERWIRDEGYLKSVPAAVNALLEQAKIKAEQIDHFILPCDQPRTPPLVAKKLGIRAQSIADNLISVCGVAGAAQPLLLLAHTLEQAKPGELILLVGFGQGCDVVLFRATEAISNVRARIGVSGALAMGRQDDNYNKFLSYNNLVEREIGKRGEVDKQTYLSAMLRKKSLLTGFIGGKCRDCGTLQIPKDNYCVNQECGALDSQDDHPFSTTQGKVKTWTADRLTFDWNPPAYFGMVEFDGGGRLMMDFTEVDADAFDTGVAVSVHFRIKQFDQQRGFRKYFWKAIQES
jgi:3-hydroxy-3-methylglutaryl CoA synthase